MSSFVSTAEEGDEGYSESPYVTQSTITTTSGTVNGQDAQQWLATMSVTDREAFVMGALNALPTSSIITIVESVRPRLYINFFRTLPAEICLRILGFLDPVSLLYTARASRQWMALSLDWKLWQQLYHREGWRTVQTEIRRFQDELEQSVPGRPRTATIGDDGHMNKKRVTPTLLSHTHADDEPSPGETNDIDMPDVGTSLFGGPAAAKKIISQIDMSSPMSGVGQSRSRSSSPSKTDDYVMSTTVTPGPSRQSTGVSSSSSHRRVLSPPKRATPTQDTPTQEGSATLFNKNTSNEKGMASTLTVRDVRTGRKMLNWYHLYKQRRRLEANWESEKYINFQLPHPDHPEEAHSQCIYTIQHIGNWLVSGSRDRTIHIWNLDTRRRVGKPLAAHKGSVLCLQFDLEEDIIISGSSDSDVIVWRFSTGQILERLKVAHNEPVLNLKFDHRILVTCSKDKTIKVFNRMPVKENDPDYPLWCDSAVVEPVPKVFQNLGFNPSPTADISIIKPYGLMGCLEGHVAAINAVQIQGNEIVSASGDRSIKVWDWPTKTCTKTLIGHSKGIACVQYDGRRVVSGSSDNEVRIFDRESGLEVASLRAHGSLVRTVQAGFGDLPYSVDEDKEEARRIDEEYFRAVDDGSVPSSAASRRGRPRNAGSCRPEDITAYGAKLPPGGGGGKYGRIVSGSYDETIIIWRRDKKGVWKPQHTFRQEDAARAASKRVDERLEQPIVGRSATFAPARRGGGVPSQAPNAPSNAATAGSSTSQNSAPQITASAGSSAAGPATQPGQPPLVPPGDSPQARQLLSAAIQAGPLRLRTTLQVHPWLARLDSVRTLISQAPIPQRHLLNGVIHQTVARFYPTLLPQDAHSTIPALSHENLFEAALLSPNDAAAQHAFMNLAQRHHHHNHNHLPPGSNARVFKLQFDARRIICCSQNPIIVGWDFANGDHDIIEASRFFAPIE